MRPPPIPLAAIETPFANGLEALAPEARPRGAPCLPTPPASFQSTPPSSTRSTRTSHPNYVPKVFGRLLRAGAGGLGHPHKPRASWPQRHAYRHRLCPGTQSPRSWSREPSGPPVRSTCWSRLSVVIPTRVIEMSTGERTSRNRGGLALGAGPPGVLHRQLPRPLVRRTPKRAFAALGAIAQP